MYDRFQLNISFGGAAMDDVADVADALVRVRNQIHSGRTEGSVMDVNGNSVGEWAFKTEHEDNDE